MGIDRETLRQLGAVVRPLATRVVNMVARGVVQLVNDGKKLQLMQLGVLVGEPVEGDKGAEHFQPYGFSSVPLAGAEAVVLFPNGDRSHPLVVAASDRRSRPTGGQPGDVVVYNAAGAKVTLLATGNIEVQPAPGGEVLIRDAGGTVDRLVKKSEFDGHTHDAGTLAAPAGVAGGPVTGISAGAASVSGTQRLRVQ